MGVTNPAADDTALRRTEGLTGSIVAPLMAERGGIAG